MTEKKEESKPVPAKSQEKPAEKKAAAPAEHRKAIAPPVTLGELTIALAAAVALIVVGFYVIGSAF